MKKRSFALLALGTVMAAALGVGTFTACKPAETEPESGYINGVNVFYGDGDEAHMQGWIVSETNDAWTVEENYVDEAAEGSPTVTKLGYSKNEAWRNFGVKIDGEYSGFSYLNITMRAETRGLTKGSVNVNLKIVNPIRDEMNVLGSDLYFDVSMDEYVTYTLEIPSKYREILDVTNDVCLFPEPGIQNSDVIHAGDIYVKDFWFSKERPADGVTPVDDTWRTEAWCGYQITRGGENEAIVSYNGPADWSRFYRPVLWEEIFTEEGTVNNMLKLQFTSDDVTIGETVYEDSVEQFQIGLWGNADPSSDGGYYQSWFGQYYRDKYEDTNDWSNNPAVFKVEKDEETGIVTLYCQVAPALIAMAGNFDEQIWICFNLESQPQGGPSDGYPGFIHGAVPFDGIGQMTILSSEFYFDENEPQYREPVVNNSVWGQNAGAYVIKAQEAGTAANITYENVAADAWACLAWGIDAADGNTAAIELCNNGTEKVLYGIDWNDANARKYGYIEPGDTVVVKVQNAAKTGAINIFLDSCYPAYDSSVTEAHSGNIDILGVTFTDETIDTPDPDEPVIGSSAWGVVTDGAGKYVITEEDGVTNVTYSDVSPTLWANLYRDVSADECKPEVTLKLRNNGTEKVHYGAELGTEDTRKYGWIEPGATVEVKLTNAVKYTVINLFLDCCYQGDYTTDKTALSGDVDILSLTFSGEFETSDPEPVGSDWVAQNDAYFTVNGNTVTLNALPIGSWTGVRTDLTLTGAGKVTLAVTNSTDHWIKLKLNLQDADGVQSVDLTYRILKQRVKAPVFAGKDIDEDGTDESYRSIRFDASIYHGNSGGGLFNAQGELIGITNAGIDGYESICYAIPVSIAEGAAENILYHYTDGDDTTNGVYTVTLGVTVSAKNAKYVLDESGYGKITEEICVETVENGSIAEEMGIAAGDTLTAVIIGGVRHELDRTFDIGDLLLTLRPNDTLQFVYTRNGADGTTERLTLTAEMFAQAE